VSHLLSPAGDGAVGTVPSGQPPAIVRFSIFRLD
jgi:hypothetical protein